MGSSLALTRSKGSAVRLFATQTDAVARSTGLALFAITRNGKRTLPGTNSEAPAVTPMLGPGRLRIEPSVRPWAVREAPQPALRAAAAKRTTITRPTGRV